MGVLYISRLTIYYLTCSDDSIGVVSHSNKITALFFLSSRRHYFKVGEGVENCDSCAAPHLLPL